MHREDNSRFLLYIEPKKEMKNIEPINDEITLLMEEFLSKAKSGTAYYSDLNDDGSNFMIDNGWRGFHCTECGERSSNKDYLLENGMITNSLAPFYLR